MGYAGDFAGTAVVSAGRSRAESGACNLVESAGDFFFFLNMPVNPLKALSEALSNLFMALLATVLLLVDVFVAADCVICWGIVLMV